MAHSVTIQIVDETILSAEFHLSEGRINVTYAEVTSTGQQLAPRRLTLASGPKPANFRGRWFQVTAAQKTALTNIMNAMKSYAALAAPEPEDTTPFVGP